MTSLRTEFFDQMASRWDEIHGGEETACMRQWCASVPLPTGERALRILDVGCGTAASSMAWSERVRGRGRVVALDNSLRMLTEGKKKRRAAGLSYLCADSSVIPLEDESISLLVALHVWPHFEDKDVVLREWRRVMEPGANAWIVHLCSRATVNTRHRDAGEAVQEDRLPPASELARFVSSYGFAVVETVDSDERYLVRAVKA